MIVASMLVFALAWPTGLQIASAADNHANMPASRQLHDAVTMADGKVMVIGGNDGVTPSAATMIYDPSLNAWSYGTSMLNARFSHTSVVLHDGRVMAIGGNNFSTGVMNLVEIYDPVTNTWSAAEPLSVRRASHVAVTLPDGRVLVAGGGNDDGDLASTEIYDPATNTWSAGPSMQATRKEFGGALMGDGRVLVAGGTVSGSMSSSVLIYDPVLNSWSPAADMSTQRFIHGMTSLEDGRVSVIGGYNSNYEQLSSTVIYDPDTNKWTSGPSMNVALIAPKAVLLQSGKVFVAGGAGHSGPSNRSESHHPVPRTPTPMASVASGEVAPGTNVTLSTFMNLGTIHYTTDGSTPTTASPVYSGPITVNGAVTVKAIAHRSDWGSSQVLTASYTLNIPLAVTPAAVPAGGDITRGTLVALSTSTAEAVIHYTTDGNTPTTTSPVYSSPIAVNSGMTIKAIAVKDGMADSFVMTEVYRTTPAIPVVTGVTPGDQFASVSFSPPFSDGGSAITKYTVTASPGGQTASSASSPIIVNGLTNGTPYTFTVTATNAVGESDASTASDSVTPAGEPGAPTGVIAAGGNGQATVSFQTPADDGGSAITSYTVTALPGGQTVSGSGSPITVTGLTNGTSYSFTVTATNSAATSSSSDPSNAVVPMTVAGTPTNVSAAWGNGEATVSFDPPADNGGSAVTQYTVTASPGGRTSTGSSSPIIVNGLTNGTPYTFTVTATNAAGASAASAASSAVTPATVPDAPTNVVATGGNGQVTVSFDAPTDNGGSAVTSYTVIASPGGHTVTGLGSPITVTGLQNGTAYTFTVTATNAAGTSDASEPSVRVTPAESPGVPIDVIVEEGMGEVTVEKGDTEVTVQFTAPANNGGSPITGYTVMVSPGGRTFSGTSSPIKVMGLDYGVFYSFTVTASNDAGTSAASNSTPGIALIAKSDAPTGISATQGNGQATVSFTSPDFTGGSPITAYTVTASPGGLTVEGTGSPIVVSGLQNGTSYTFTVAAKNAAGISDASLPSAAVIPATAPGVPTNVSAVAGNGQATVSFTAPADNGGSPITRYSVTVLPGGRTVAGTESPILVTGLENGTPYTFKVAAENLAGSSAASGESAAITPYVPAYVPQEISADVLINGKSINAGKIRTSETNGRKVKTLEVDEAKLEEKLKTETQGAVIEIPVSAVGSDVVSGELNGRMVQYLEEKSAVILIQTGTSSYSLPARQINIKSLAAEFGENVALQNIKIRIEIGSPSGETAAAVKQLADSGEFQLVVPAVEFIVSATYDGKTVAVERFDAYVERMIAIPDGVDPARITTGVVVEEGGNVRHMPTKIIMSEGRFYAQINSLTNSTYSVIWHLVTFEDAKGHWAEAAINDMGSRLVISGVDDRTFLPKQNVTRAEFAAMLVRALGLKPDASNVSFADVEVKSWYAGYVGAAVEYGLIEGFGDGTFRPEAMITREQAMSMTAKALRLTGDELTELDAAQVQSIIAGFGDGSAAGAWATDSIALLTKHGLVIGAAGNRLAPKALMTRAEAAVMVQRLLKQSELI